jgi:acetyl-CoA carboxylase carboxyltransferase component
MISDVSDIEKDLRELDRRVTHVEAIMSSIQSSMLDIKDTLNKVTDSQQKLEIKMAWAAGAVAISLLLGQLVIQAIFASIN